MNMTDQEFIKLLKSFARTISSQPFTSIKHSPEPGANVNTCYANAEDKAARSGGRVQYGWIFNHRFTADFTSVGYFIATHHAVWRDPSNRLVDVTPFNQQIKHQPINQNGQVYFQVDDKAQPVLISGVGAPLPMKFFPLNNGNKLKAHIEAMEEREQASCQEYYQTISEQVKSNSQ